MQQGIKKLQWFEYLKVVFLEILNPLLCRVFANQVTYYSPVATIWLKMAEPKHVILMSDTFLPAVTKNSRSVKINLATTCDLIIHSASHLHFNKHLIPLYICI